MNSNAPHDEKKTFSGGKKCNLISPTSEMSFISEMTIIHSNLSTRHQTTLLINANDSWFLFYTATPYIIYHNITAVEEFESKRKL